MKEYASHYVGCHLPYDLAIDVAKKNMIDFSKLAKLDHYKKYMVHNVSNSIADTDEQNIATVVSSRVMTSKLKKKLSKSDSKLWFNQLDAMELHYFY